MAQAVVKDRATKNMTTKVLFLCTGNACRSQMAHGWANALKLSGVEFYSAGIEKHGVNPHAITVMQESGIDISAHQSQLLSEFDDIDFNVIFAVCDKASENCPAVGANSKVICHRFDDPPMLAAKATSHQQKLDCYRQVRDQIQQWIAQLPQQLATI